MVPAHMLSLTVPQKVGYVDCPRDSWVVVQVHQATQNIITEFHIIPTFEDSTLSSGSRNRRHTS